MEYTVQGLAKLAGISARTIRHYDQIGLLRPQRISSSGYRIYGAAQVDRLQMILLYRELEMELGEIRRVLDDPRHDADRALEQHLRQMRERQARLGAIIDTIEQTIQSNKEGIPMSDAKKFEGFKKQLVDENEQKYGAEIREKYGEQTVDESNRKMMNLTQEQYAQMQQTSEQLQSLLEQAVKDGASPEGEIGGRLTQLHKQWLSYTWPHYSAEAHKGLTQMYIDDPRFTAYYDKTTSGCAAFLRDAVAHHAS